MAEGYKVARSSNSHPTYHLIATLNNQSSRILVKHLQYDSAYNESLLPYQVYKIDAFETKEQQSLGLKEIDLVVSYNFKDKSFACLDIEQFVHKKSRVIHQKEGQNSDYYNSWKLLNSGLNVN